MAKKSSKKGSKRNLLVALCLFAISVVVACMCFVYGAKLSVTVMGSTSTSTVAGMDFTFGNSDSGYAFNTFAFLGYFLPVMGALVYVLLFVLLGNKAKIAVLLPTLCFVVGAVFCFLSVKGFTNVNGAPLVGTYSLGLGPILGGSFACLGALIGFYGTYVALVK